MYRSFANATMMRCLALAYFATTAAAWTTTTPPSLPRSRHNTVLSQSATTSTSWFPEVASTDSAAPVASTEQLKAQILQLGAALDRGQAYNPTAGDYYKETMDVAKTKILNLLEASPNKFPTSLEQLEGEWELILTTVPHGIFRSSPFFLAVQEAFGYGEKTEAFGQDKATLFFKLHELQTCSWGVSKIGRVAQRFDSKKGYMYSEFDTSIFSLTVIPFLGWGKILPTFGGCVVTASTCTLSEVGKLDMEVDFTTSRPVPGLSGLGEWIWKVRVPVGVFWKLLPWNKGRPASCSVNVRYVDNDFRIVEDLTGDLFVYTRPVVPRALDLSV